MTETLRCRACGDVIGVYEPLVTLIDGQANETSRAAREDVGALGEECYHHACFTPVHGEREVLG